MKYLITIFLLFSTSVNAVDSNNKYSILGTGNASCASYVKDFKNEVLFNYYAAWANGYFTHMNLTMPKTFDVTTSVDLTARQQWLYEYCKKHTLDNFDTAVKELTKELIKRMP